MELGDALNRQANPPEALWAKALGGVSPELRELINGAQPNKRASLEIILYAAEQQRELCIRRQWKIKKRNGDVIILRDVFEKIVQCINKFKELGKAVAQISPEHAALPWAAIAILLQTGINDTTAFAAMVDGLEVSTSIIARCAIFESVYLLQATSATSHLESSLVSLYGTVLTFLGTCFKYFSAGTARRILRAVRDPAKEIEDAMRHVESRQTEVERTAHIMNMEMLTITSTHVVDLKSMVSSLTLQLEAANARLNGPEEEEAADSSAQRMESMSAAIASIMGPKQRVVKVSGRKDGLGPDGRVVRFDWLSSVRYQSNHQTEAQNRMPGSGQWLFQRPEFRFWTDSSISGTLWLHGPPGCGKTKLASAVIDFDRARAKAQAGLVAPIAYFYCGGGDAERSQPTEVLRCIARQLCGDDPDAPINEDLNHAYEGAGNPQIGQSRLSIEATVALVLKALTQNPATIVIDALDELRPDDRHELWDCLDNIVRDSPNVVKAFLTSRDDGDIVCRLSSTPNIYISVQDNQSDIERFTEQELDAAVARKRLLRGVVSEQLRWKISTALNQGSQGMFRWVSLQIQNLCDSRRMRLEEDVLHELRQLPQSLSDLYAISFSQISQLSPSSYQVAVSMLQLMLVAIRPISWTEIQHLIQVSHPAVRHGISREQLLDITCNFVADDRQGEGRPRLAHHSVREYLRTRPEFASGVSNGKVAEMCLHHIREPASPLTKKFCYSTFYLGSHLSATSAGDRLPLRDWLKELLLPFGTSSATMSNRLFAKWRRNLSSLIDAKLLTMRHGIDSAHQCQETMISVTPLAAACAMGLVEMLPQLRPSQNDLFDPVDIPNRDELLTFEGADSMGSYYGKSCVLMAVILDRRDIVSLVHDLGFSVDTPLKTGETALWLAVKRGKPEMVQRLLDYGADPNQTGPNEYFRPKASTKAILRPITGPAADIIADRKLASSVLGFHVRDSSGRLAVQSPFHYEGETYPVLHIAMHTGRGAEIVDQLIRAGADINARTSRGLTSLEFCLEYSSLGIMFEVFGTLLRAGVSPDLELQNGRTIAHIVAAMGHAELMEMLLEAGANCALRDHFAQSPLDLARRYGHPETAKLLISRGAVTPPVASSGESPDECDDEENVLMGPPPPLYRSRSELELESSTAQNPSILVQDHDNDSSKVPPTVSNTEPRPQSSPGYAPPTTLEDISEDTAAPRLEVPEVAKVSRRKSFGDSWKKLKSFFGSGTP